jgi:ADP-dependent NAD(P)H-hydrate dehydratase / NAD(P)H-hydrate epimerase
MKVFDQSELRNLYKPNVNSSGEQNGQVTIIGGSKLFHGAPIFALKIASRFNDMVFFATPEPSVGRVAELVKSKLMNFIWIDWADTESYVEKSDAVLIGPGFMRFGSEKTSEKEKANLSHQEGIMTKHVTESFLKNFPNKRWVIDAGSLQVMNADLIPKGSIITPNVKEFSILFGVDESDVRNMSIEEKEVVVSDKAKKYDCIIVSKGPKTLVCSPEKSMIVSNGNPGLTKGGTGDALAGLTVALLAKNDPFLAACCASYISKKTADELYDKVGVNYNADDLVDNVPETLHNLLK